MYAERQSGRRSSINNDPASTWTAGRNTNFEGATLLDAKKIQGTLQNLDKPKLEVKLLESVDLPTNFDWRTDPRAANCPTVKEIRDQANCGSCWAFGSVEAMSDRICISSKGAKNIHFSAQDMTSCATMYGNMGCNGGVPESAYSYYKNNGVVSGGNYGDTSGCWSYQLAPCAHHTNSTKYPACPDSNKTPKCGRECTDDTSLKWSTDKHHGSAATLVCQSGLDQGACAEAMAQEIYQNGPITGMFFVHQSFTAYKSGVYQHKKIGDPMLGGHAIKIMGFGEENGTPYWLVANSWNEQWGDNGYFKIKRGSNECDIENPVINGGPVAGEPAA